MPYVCVFDWLLPNMPQAVSTWCLPSSNLVQFIWFNNAHRQHSMRNDYSRFRILKSSFKGYGNAMKVRIDGPWLSQRIRPFVGYTFLHVHTPGHFVGHYSVKTAQKRSL